MKFERTKIYNFEGAFHGMRNPMNSWEKSDSYFGLISEDYDEMDWEIAEKWVHKKYQDEKYEEIFENHTNEVEEVDKWLIQNGILEENSDYFLANVAFIGPDDMDLAQRLIKAGPEHRKFLRQIFVSVDITASLYFFKEFDTYKVSTTANSTSTMHKLASTPITLECFEIDDYDSSLEWTGTPCGDLTCSYTENSILRLIDMLEGLRLKYNKTKDKRYWKELIRWLPESWLQTRTITMNYENLRNMYFQRQNHKLAEWHTFCHWVEGLPYAKELILYK